MSDPLRENPPLRTTTWWQRIVGAQLDAILDSGFLEAVRDARLHLRERAPDPEVAERIADEDYSSWANDLENWRDSDLAMLRAVNSARLTLELYLDLSEVLLADGFEGCSAVITGNDILDEMLERLSWRSVNEDFPVEAAEEILSTLQHSARLMEWCLEMCPAPPEE